MFKETISLVSQSHRLALVNSNFSFPTLTRGGWEVEAESQAHRLALVNSNVCPDGGVIPPQATSQSHHLALVNSNIAYLPLLRRSAVTVTIPPSSSGQFQLSPWQNWENAQLRAAESQSHRLALVNSNQCLTARRGPAQGRRNPT